MIFESYLLPDLIITSRCSLRRVSSWMRWCGFRLGTEVNHNPSIPSIYARSEKVSISFHSKVLPAPAIIKPRPLWTGKQLFSMICPKLNYRWVPYFHTFTRVQSILSISLERGPSHILHIFPFADAYVFCRGKAKNHDDKEIMKHRDPFNHLDSEVLIHSGYLAPISTF